MNEFRDRQLNKSYNIRLYHRKYRKFMGTPLIVTAVINMYQAPNKCMILKSKKFMTRQLSVY